MAQASAEKLKHTGPAEKERVASVPRREQMARTPEPPLPKRKRNRAVCPEYQIMRGERFNVGESSTLARERRIRARAWGGKGKLHDKGRQIPRRTGRTCKKSLPRTSRRKHERVSGRKTLQDDLQSLGFTPSLGKPVIGKEVGRRRGRS